MFYSVKTFGCKVNTYDSSLIQKRMEEQGFKERSFNENTKKPHIHIVNTCAVTETAVKEAERWIRKYRKKNPQARILAAGCAAQVETNRLAALTEVDTVIANSNKSELVNIVKNKEKHSKQKIFKSSIFKHKALEAEGRLENHHSRLFLKIQDGCDSFCSFCIIPFARGKSRSIPPEILIDSVKKHYDQGVREVVLTGVHIGDYQPDLAGLVKQILEKTNIPRIRLSSLEPVELTKPLLELYSSSRMCPHFHISLQSANTHVLKRMKRTYQAEDVENSLMNIHKKLPHAFVGMDLIAGFGGESRQEFEDSFLRLKNLPWTKMHIFPYSPRKYTFANRYYETLSRSVIAQRAKQLRHLSAVRYKREMDKQIGCIKKVLAWKNKPDLGVSRDYWTVRFSQKEKPKNRRSEVVVKIHSVNERRGFLIGESLSLQKQGR